MTTPKKKARVRKPKPFKFRGAQLIVAEAYERFAQISTCYPGPITARRLAKWLTQFADWEESRKK